MFYNKTCAIYNTMRSRFIYNAHARPAMRAVHWSAALVPPPLCSGFPVFSRLPCVLPLSPCPCPLPSSLPALVACHYAGKLHTAPLGAGCLVAARRGAPPCPVPPCAAGGLLGCEAPLCSCPLSALSSCRCKQCAYAGWRAARPLRCPAISYPLSSGQREHGAELFARQRSLSAPPLCPGPLALSCPLSARPRSPCAAPLPWLQGLWPSVSLSPSSLYPPGVHCTKQCARQPSHSLFTFLPPGVLVSWQVARTLHCTRLRPLSLVPTLSHCKKLRRHVAHCTSGSGLPSGSTLRHPDVSRAPACRGWPARLRGTFVVLAPVR